MTAKEMWDRLYCIVIETDEYVSVYQSPEDAEYDVWHFRFSRYFPTVEFNWELIHSINGLAIQAIHQQTKELGWLE